MSAPSPDSIIETLRGYLLEELLEQDELEDLGADDNLVTDGLVDSVGAVQLAMYIEETYAIKVESTDFTIDNFRSLNCLAAFIGTRLANGG